LSKEPEHSPDEHDLFRKEVQDVRPLQAGRRSTSRPPRPDPHPHQREADERAVLGELLVSPSDPAEMHTGEELEYLRPGIQRRYLDRLRRGRYSIGDSLDLHQMNREAARTAILDFLDQAQARGIGCVRIVHGKGLRSRNGPQLKRLAGRLLSRHPAVLAFASCRPVDGGTGAVTVLLKMR
jgi:DNA-nicking Smr family endonuclease